MLSAHVDAVGVGVGQTGEVAEDAGGDGGDGGIAVGGIEGGHDGDDVRASREKDDSCVALCASERAGLFRRR